MHACPKCKSTEAHAASVVHRSQTSNTIATTVGAGLTIGGEAGLGVATTTGTSQSLMAQQAAPPKPPSHMAYGCVLYVALFFVYGLSNLALVQVLGTADSVWGNTFAFGTMIGGGAAIIYWMRQRTKAQLPAWEKRMEEWQRTWVCDRCGTQFVIP